MLTPSDIKNEKQLIAFMSLPYKGQRDQWLQAYFSNLFDLWENPPFDLTEELDHRLIMARSEVRDHCRFDPDRDCQWQVVFNERGELHDPFCNCGGTLIQ